MGAKRVSAGRDGTEVEVPRSVAPNPLFMEPLQENARCGARPSLWIHDQSGDLSTFLQHQQAEVVLRSAGLDHRVPREGRATLSTDDDHLFWFSER
jgi:hypothetical protein